MNLKDKIVQRYKLNPHPYHDCVDAAIDVVLDEAYNAISKMLINRSCTCSFDINKTLQKLKELE